MSKSEFIVDKEKLQVRSSRVFKTSREKLWHAMTDPAMISQWWGPAIYNTVVEKLEFTVGGQWRFVQTAEDGGKHAFHGVYKEIDAPNRVVQTFCYEPFPDSELIETMTLEDVDGGVKLSNTSQYNQLSDLEGMVSTGMEGGNNESHDRLAKLVEDAV